MLNLWEKFMISPLFFGVEVLPEPWRAWPRLLVEAEATSVEPVTARLSGVSVLERDPDCACLLFVGDRAAVEALYCIARVSDPLLLWALFLAALDDSCGRMRFAMCVLVDGEIGEIGFGSFSGSTTESFHESRLGSGGSSLFKLTVFNFFGCSTSSGFPLEVPGRLLLLEVDRRGSAQLRQPVALGGGSAVDES